MLYLLGDRVAPLEALSPRRHHLTDREQHRDCTLRIAPVPPRAALLAGPGLEVAHELRPVLGELLANALHCGCQLVDALGIALPVIVHAPGKERAILDPNERGFVRPILGELAARPQMPVESLLVVPAVP